MTLGVAAVVAAESWDARHEASKALEDLMQEHELLALALASKLESTRGPAVPSGAGAVPATAVLCEAGVALERAGGVVVVLKVAGVPGLRTCHETAPAVATLDQAARAGTRALVLSREEAARLGLPERTAVAGLAKLPPTSGLTAVAVTGSAASERDRSRRQQARTMISMGVVSALILGFGLADLRRQRREVVLERQVELEKARQERDSELAKANRMATLAALASGFAHELGTPLGIISGRIEQLGSSALAPERRTELLGQVRSQVERLGTLIRSFLAFARGEVGLLEQVAAADLAASAARLVRHRFAASNVELELELAEAGQLRAACERALFEQVIVNLLTNALEASSQGDRVCLKVERSGEQIAFTVLDEGSGIPASVMERVTEPFFTTKARSGGTGLGLTIAKEIVAHHRGTLEIRRRETSRGTIRGTLVVIRIPRLGETSDERQKS